MSLNDYAQNVAFAAVQLATRVENPGTLEATDRIAAAAIGVADSEALGIKWNGRYDDTMDKVAVLIASETDYDEIRRQTMNIVKKEVA